MDQNAYGEYVSDRDRILIDVSKTYEGKNPVTSYIESMNTMKKLT